MIILTIILMDLLTGMEFDLFVPSFPELRNIFHLSPFEVELSLSINFIGYCISLFLVAELADRYGRKPIILIGLLTFILGSVLCLATHSYYIFLGGRFLQGLGIAAPAILSFLIVADSYAIKKQQFLLSMLNAAMNVSVAFAPVVGSFITKQFHWEGNFITLLFLGLAVFCMCILFVPHQKTLYKKKISSLHSYTGILKSKIILLLVIFFILMFVPYWVFVGMSPLLYMKDLGVSLTYFGYYQGSLALAFALGGLLFGLIITRYDQKNMLYIAMFIFFISLTSILVAAFKNSSALFITLSFLPFVIGQIIPSNILYPLYLNLLPEAKGRLTAIIQAGRLIVASLGLQIAGYFYQGTFLNIGVMLASLIFAGIILMFFVVKQWSLIENTG
jgi:DHA1 family bicyclomycin/chloramphenicol resistance-like MFS transporter